ncbi:hypothetical protein PFFCH_05197 [Plasmodium falciparum FCH/4]|uniref:Uncharacterized protein n=1 Tax=Plasmodium falciparum FCH/4 TaxID=1036724 RepID=A0A024VGY7_PLAFA|nr:hypothetical protein PFFCH_05197 [Plasmodium falciparum FCH/4]
MPEPKQIYANNIFDNDKLKRFFLKYRSKEKVLYSFTSENDIINEEKRKSKNNLCMLKYKVLVKQERKLSQKILTNRKENFTEITEVLKEKIMIFINLIAEIIHECCDFYGGTINKNIGDAFLLVWKYQKKEYSNKKMNMFKSPNNNYDEYSEKENINRICDLAFLSTVQTLIKLRKLYEEYAKNDDIKFIKIHYPKDYLEQFKIALESYLIGKWNESKNILEYLKRNNIFEDEILNQLWNFLSMNNFIAPSDWCGYRKFLQKS